MTIAGTGHRPNKLGFEWELKGPYSERIYDEIMIKIKQYTPDSIISGVALGFDMVLAFAAINNNIDLIAAVPCLRQDLKWSKYCKELYRKILKGAKTVHYVSNMPYFKGCMDRRNEWMVDQLVEDDDLLLGCYNGTNGGTHNCIEYAKKKNKNIEIINPSTFFS